MVQKEDWDAAMSSEVFREFAANELRQESVKAAQQERDNIAAIQALEDLKARVKHDPNLKVAFQQYRKQLNDPKIRDSVDPAIAEAIFLLDLED